MTLNRHLARVAALAIRPAVGSVLMLWISGSVKDLLFADIKPGLQHYRPELVWHQVWDQVWDQVWVQVWHQIASAII